MRILLLGLLGSSIFCESLAVQIQPDSTTSIVDSTTMERSVSFTPYSFKQNLKLLPFSSYYLDNEIQTKNNIGRSILYTQYGQSPSQMVLNNDFPSITSVGWRLEGVPLLILNGIPFNSKLNEVSNLNTFDFEPGLVLPGLGASAYGATSGNGALFLMPKSGKGDTTTRVDVNSYTSQYSSQNKDSELSSLSQVTSLALSKDFGKVNGRISLNHAITPDDYSPVTGEPLYGARKSLTSFIEFSPIKNLHGSFYFQQANRKLEGEYDKEYEVYQISKYSNSHLKLEYNITHWLKWESNASFQKGDYQKDITVTTTKYVIANKEDKRGLLNSFLIANVNSNAKLVISPFIGAQSENVTYRNLETTNDPAQQVNKQMLLGGINSTLSDVVTMNFTHRIEKITDFPNQLNYSVNAAADFSKYLRFSRVTLAKIRAGFGEGPIWFEEFYPTYTKTQSPPPNNLNNRKSIEGGIDFVLFKNNLQVSYTYFFDMLGDLRITIIDPQFQTSYSAGELVKAGHEIMLKSNFKFSDRYSMISSLIFTDYAYGPVKSGGIVPLAESIPNWKLSFLTQFAVKNFGLTIMLDQRNGGEYRISEGYYDRVFTGDPLVLREFSMYVNLPLSSSSRSNRWRISYIGRNLSSLNGDDLEAFNGYYIQKESTISISATF